LRTSNARQGNVTGSDYPIITIHEAGLDGFWVHRVLQNEGIESHVVDAASIATSRRRRRAKTDKIDGEALLRALLAFKRGEPRVCAMVVAPSSEEEDRRRLCRERQTLLDERIVHTNRIKGLLFAQGISDYAPLRRDRRKRLEDLRTGDGRPLPVHLKTQISRELDRLELVDPDDHSPFEPQVPFEPAPWPPEEPEPVERPGETEENPFADDEEPMLAGELPKIPPDGALPGRRR